MREDPPGGGPLAAVLAGLAACDGEVVAVLAGDMPAGGAVLPRLVAALGADEGAGAAVAEDDDGRVTPLLGVYRRSSLAHLGLGSGHGGRAMALLDAGYLSVRVGAAAARDVDTPQALAEAQADLGSPRGRRGPISDDRPPATGPPASRRRARERPLPRSR